jgi:tRNA pseudouridine55 synthase
MRDAAGPDAVIRVDKPQGPTSHDVVAAARRALRTRRVGHTGTLDPFASGLLLLVVGSATRLSEYLTALPKTYRATLRLGVVTDTDDRTGTALREYAAAAAVPRADVERALAAQQGPLSQLPPLYSAKKVGGERMYAAARRGETPERTRVDVTVHRIELLRYDAPEAEFEVECSSGTYIRSIARDVGEALGVGAHLSALRRTRVGVHDVGDAVAPEALAELSPASAAWLAPEDALGHLPQLRLSEAEARDIGHGRSVAAPEGIPAGATVVLRGAAGGMLAIAVRDAGWLRPRKVFA